MTARTTTCMTLLLVFSLFTSFPAIAKHDRTLSNLVAPDRVWVEPFATTPIEIVDQLGQGEPKIFVGPVYDKFSPAAREILYRSMEAKRYGVILTSPRGGQVVGKYPAVTWIQTGTQCFCMRRDWITGHIKVITIGRNRNQGNHATDGDFVFEIVPGSSSMIAPGDRFIMPDEFAVVTPRVCWTPVPTATGYRVERICKSTFTSGKVVYEGTATSFTDPTLREAIGTDDVYEYRVWTLRGNERSAHPGIAGSIIKETPLRAVMASCYPSLHRGTSAYTDLLLNALQYHPNPGIRLSAVWELGHTHDLSLLPRLTLLLQAKDPELAANAKLVVGMLTKPDRRDTVNSYAGRITGYSTAPMVRIGK